MKQVDIIMLTFVIVTGLTLLIMMVAGVVASAI